MRPKKNLRPGVCALINNYTCPTPPPVVPLQGHILKFHLECDSKLADTVRKVLIQFQTLANEANIRARLHRLLTSVEKLCCNFSHNQSKISSILQQPFDLSAPCPKVKVLKVPVNSPSPSLDNIQPSPASLNYSSPARTRILPQPVGNTDSGKAIRVNCFIY